MKCLYCNSLSTERNGKRILHFVGCDRKTKRTTQRYICNECKGSFSIRKDKHKHYSSEFKEEIVRIHIEEGMSFRVMSKRLKEKYGIKISAGYLCRLFNNTIKNVKASKQMKEEYNPQWDGYLIIDDKIINVKGEKQVSLIAKDKSGDIVHQE